MTSLPSGRSPAISTSRTLRTASYAVSLEPSGGSPSGVPTGPVLFTGKIVESVPTAAPGTADIIPQRRRQKQKARHKAGLSGD